MAALTLASKTRTDSRNADPKEHHVTPMTDTTAPAPHQVVTRELVGATIAEVGAPAGSTRFEAALAALAALPPASQALATVDITLTATEALALLAERLDIPTADAFAWVLHQRSQKAA